MSKCLILLCGPPACLKSTLNRILRCLLSSQSTDGELKRLCLNKLRSILQHPLDENLSCFVFSFDELLIDFQEEIFQNESKWKFSRNLIADAVENELIAVASSSSNDSPIVERFRQRLNEFSSNRPMIWIIEDNFYYSSMRNRFHQIAQRAQIGFASIHLISDISVARQRNARRDEKQRVSDRSFETIFSKYEFSTSDLILNTTENGLTIEHVEKVLQRIEKARREPEKLVDFELEEEKRRKATEINRQNVFYQLDQKLRKIFSKILREKCSTSDAKLLNEKRQKFFEMIKTERQPIDDDELEVRFEEFIRKN